MWAFSSLANLERLDLERYPKIHSGLVHLKGLPNLKELQISNCKITDLGVSYLRCGLLFCFHFPCSNNRQEYLFSPVGLVVQLSLMMDMISFLIAGRSGKLEGVKLGFQQHNRCMFVAFKRLEKFGELNLDSCKLVDEGLSYLTGFKQGIMERGDLISQFIVDDRVEYLQLE